MTAAAKTFLSAFSQITGTGRFHAAGAEPFFLPGLHIEGLGEVAFPLPVSQAKEIIALSEAAPFGKGDRTVFDESVRKCWQIDAASFAFRSPQWKKFLRRTLDAIQDTLGIGGEISASPYKFLLYGPGGHFKAHKDTEKLDAMFGTLVIALPSAHEGGRLLIRHDGTESEVDFSDPEASRDIRYAAFFADCEHEVEPVRKGYRCCVVYNLRLDKGDPALLNLSLTDQGRSLLPALAGLKADLDGELGAVLLEHSYTEANLSLPKLKGNDQARAHALLAAAAESGLTAHLALVTLHQSGALEDYDYGRHRRRHYYDEDEEPSGGTMGEIFEESLCLSDWRDARNRRRDFGIYHIEPDQLIASGDLADGDPDEQEAEGYTGNAGCTMDYWYRRAAIVLWAKEDEEAILCRHNFGGACAELETLAVAKKTGPGSPFYRLASAVVESYPEKLPHLGEYSYRRDFSHDPLRSVFAALAATKSRELLDSLLTKLPAQAYQIVDTVLWTKLHQAFGGEVFEPVYKDLLRETAVQQRRPLFQVLASLATRSDGASRVRAIAARLAALGPAKPVPGYQREGRDPQPVGDCEEARAFLASSHHLTDAGERAAVRGFLQADSSVPYVREILGPALLDRGIASALKKPRSLAPELLEFAIAILEAEVARPLPPYPDWIRPCPEPGKEPSHSAPSFARPSSKRPDPIRELADFMADPGARSHHFIRPEGERLRIEEFIRRHCLDLDCTTIRKGSPHTLACTKNDGSHQHALALREKDRELLAKLGQRRG
jgi:hypothetical protein